ncbi:MAG: GNAT family N-acetyltransferase [Acidimicrobiia bacterium]|nr:GNAT family N-acetyltransferase [Acidimicrobiia bacterium]
MNETRDHPAGGAGAIPRIRDAREDDLDVLADVLTRAFVDAPYWSWAFTDRRGNRARRLHRFEKIQLRGAFLKHRVLRTVEDCSAVAIWIPPDSPGPGLPLRLAPHAALVFGRDAPRNLRAGRELRRHLPAEPYWFLMGLAVTPERQGGHLGALLVADGLQGAEEDGVPVILETSNPANIGFYRHLGFDLIDQYDIPACGPPRWFFRRDPRVG